MYNFGKVVPKAQFFVWAQSTERQNAANTKILPPFAYTYVPDANGANVAGTTPTTSTRTARLKPYGATTCPPGPKARKDD